MDVMWIILIAVSLLLNVVIIVLLVRMLNHKSQTNEMFQNFDKTVRDEFHRNRSELSTPLKGVSESLFGFQQSVQQQIDRFRTENETKILHLQDTVHQNLSNVRREVVEALEQLEKKNTGQLEKIRETVDEKLQKTLETRLGHSFEQVSKHLESVQQGLGEMRILAGGVGDLKKVLTNVKTKGMLGEIQLNNILEHVLSPEQFGINVATIPNSSNFVEFAIRLPGKDTDREVWLPIDSKFPLSKYEALLDAYDSADVQQITNAQKELYKTVKLMAKDIRDKYISPPYTTDFGVLFLPTEGLYAEVIRDATLFEELQRDYKIIVSGPSNLSAFINSLQMGFKTLAIEQRSSEVWKVLSAVKSEFGKFGEIITKVQDKLIQASQTIDKVGVRSRAIQRSLKDVEVSNDNIEIDGILREKQQED